MLAIARERHPAHSVGHIRLLSSPFRPGGGGEGLGERGGMNKALKLLQRGPARPLHGFRAASPCWTCVRSYQRCSNSYAATPTLTPNPSPAPPGGKGEPTALCGRVLEVVEFTVSRQPSKRTQAASLESQANVVPGEFECWPLRVNATPDKALATYGC